MSNGTPLPDLSAFLLDQGVILRPRREDDADFLRDVYVAYRWEEVAATGWPEDMRLAFLHDQYRMQCHQLDNHYDGAAWGVIEVAGERAGRLYLLKGTDDLHIIDIALMPTFRNQGMGGALLSAAQDMARQLGVAKVSIHVESNNPALRLYERLGFAKIEQRGIYFLMEWPVQPKTASY